MFKIDIFSNINKIIENKKIFKNYNSDLLFLINKNKKLNYDLNNKIVSNKKLKNELYSLLYKNLLFFFLSYSFFFKNYYNDIFTFLVQKKNIILKSYSWFYWTFANNQRIFLNFQNTKKKNIFFLTNGLFLKYFKKKKSLKKKKALRLLLARYLRKLFLIINFKNVIFFLKKTPSLFVEMFKILNSNIVHKFINPFNRKFFFDVKKKKLLNIDYFIFYKNIDFSKNKVKKKGRLKRKVTRKLVLIDSIID